ncbi:MAG: sulfatase [Candidatus Hydrogenedentes bacterium]|nr:sulfatase [Candidatus Hydrogenedentota bacterium]
MKYFVLLSALIPPFLAAAAPNVLLLSVDTLRADRLGAYGYALPTSPNLDAFAREALLFEDAVCEVPLTGPSMGAMLSGRYPRMTGTTRNGLRMPDEVPLATDQFAAAGYHTFCVQSNWTLKANLSGMDRGFALYDDDFRKKRWGFMKPERDGDDVTDIALKFLAERPNDKPFFGWVHYSDPHAPYKMHRKFRPAGKRAWYLGHEEKTRVKYDSEVAFTDNEIGKLLAALPEDTIVVFVADHGESLFEHGYLGHGRKIYQNGMHIPLMIRAPGVDPERTATPARGIDIGPTLLGLAGLPVPDSMVGFDLLKENIPADRARVVETYGGAVPNLPGVKDVMAEAGPLMQGVIHEGWKLILEADRRELYYLPEDPAELNDRAAEDPDRADTLQQIIQRWEEATPVRAQGEENLNAEDLKALEALGYLE